MIEQIDLNLNLDYDADARKIVNVTFDDKEYKQVQFQCVVGELRYHKPRAFMEPAFNSMIESLELQYNCKYCTKPVAKAFGDKWIAVCLGLEKL